MQDTLQIDIPASKARSIGLAAIGFGFVALSAGYLAYGPRGGAGTFIEFALYSGVALGCVGIASGLYNVVRSGPVLSIGPRGIFDRRLSEDWIPWDAIASMTSTTIRNNSSLMVELDPARDATMPIKRRARWIARANAGFGFQGYPIAGTTVVGGFPAILDAVRRFAPPGR